MSSAEFNPIPSRDGFKTLTVRVASSAPDDAEAIGVPVAQAGGVPDLLGTDRAALEALDFTGEAGQALRMPRPDGLTGDTPWAHIDIAGTAMVNADDSWRAQGGSGFGARLLAELAVNFAPPRASA